MMFAVRKSARFTMAMGAKFTHLQTQSRAEAFSARQKSNAAKRTGTVDLAYSVYDEHCLPDSAAITAVVITHGLFGSRNNWHSLAKALNKTTKRKVSQFQDSSRAIRLHAIYTVDLRCHGDSPHSDHVDYDILSEDVLYLVTNRLGLNRIAFLGHSLGGSTVLYAAIKRPDLVECVTSVDISLVPFCKKDETIKYMNTMLNAKWDPTLTLAAVRKVVDTQLEKVVTEPSVRQWLLTNLVHDGNQVRWRLDLKSLRQNYQLLFKESSIQGKYSGPTLYVCGELSDYVRKNLHHVIRGDFPDAQFVYVPGANHWVHSEKPKEFLEITSTFLNDVNAKK